jgi:hypothetical protein
MLASSGTAAVGSTAATSCCSDARRLRWQGPTNCSNRRADNGVCESARDVDAGVRKMRCLTAQHQFELVEKKTSSGCPLLR